MWLNVLYSMDVNLIERLSPEKISPKIGVFIGGASGLIVGMCGYFIWHMNLLPAAILIGISVLLDLGSGAAIRRYILRFWFFRYNVLPKDAEFLDVAVRTRLLEEDGGGYKFSQGADLQEYFRELPRN